MQRTFLQARLLRESSAGVRGAQHASAALQEEYEVRTVCTLWVVVELLL